MKIMKSYITISALLLSTIIFSCKKKDFNPDCNGETMSFSGDVFPIFQSSCISCHSSGDSKPLDNYSNIAANKTLIRSVIISERMPKDKKLSDNEKNTIICWIDDGAKNN